MAFITLKNEDNLPVDVNVNMIKYFRSPEKRPGQVCIYIGDGHIFVNESMESVRSAISGDPVQPVINPPDKPAGNFDGLWGWPQ